MRITPAMIGATTLTDMADAFHPMQFGRDYHMDIALDAIEAALLYGAGRITQKEFFEAIEDLDVDE